MLTGDNEATARRIADQLGIDDGHRRGAARRQGRQGRRAAAAGPTGGDGRRRRQRRPRARPGRRRHRHRRRHRRRHRDRRRRADALGPARRAHRAADRPRHPAQDAAEPRLGGRLQRRSRCPSPPACSSRRSASCCARRSRRSRCPAPASSSPSTRCCSSGCACRPHPRPGPPAPHEPGHPWATPRRDSSLRRSHEPRRRTRPASRSRPVNRARLRVDKEHGDRQHPEPAAVSGDGRPATGRGAGNEPTDAAGRVHLRRVADANGTPEDEGSPP